MAPSPGRLRPDMVALMGDLARWQRDNAVPPRAEQSVADMRSIYSRQARLRDEGPVPIQAMAEEFDRRVATRAGERRVRVHRPNAPGPLPVLVYVHGGGYVIGGIEETQAEARRLAAALPALVVSISYRFAPEDPYPAAIEDVEDQVRAIAAGHIEDVPAARVAVAGVSAGAGLAVAAAGRMVAAGNCPIGLLVLLSPCLDLTVETPSMTLFGKGFGLEREAMQRFAELYLPEGIPADHPEASPARHPVPEGFPPVIQFAAECDPLADGAALYARRLCEAGIDNEIAFVSGVTHGFNGWFARLPSTAPDFDRLHAAIRARLAAWGREGRS